MQRTATQLVTSLHASAQPGPGHHLYELVTGYPILSPQSKPSAPLPTSTGGFHAIRLLPHMAGGYPRLRARPPRAHSSPQAIPWHTYPLTPSTYFSLLLNSHLCSCPGLARARRFVAAALGSAARPMPVGRINPKPPRSGLPNATEPKGTGHCFAKTRQI